MIFSVLTLFPEYFKTPLESSLMGRAIQSGRLQVKLHGLREFGEGKYRAVDDRPYGGGPGMVMMAPVLEKALSSVLGGEEALSQLEQNVAGASTSSTSVPHVVYLSPQGKPLTASKARELASHPHLLLLCGHYEGVDERALESFVHEEISIGDYILTGGEPAALVLMDAISRFIPGVVGEAESVSKDTFESNAEMVSGGLKAPVYTRPEQWRGHGVPAVLLSGHHGEISKWRLEQSKRRTEARRPDLLKREK